jgi:p-methyltransferase
MVDRAAGGIAALRDRGILTFASFIVGFPGETDETAAHTRAFIEEHRPDFYRAEIWYADPGTPVMRDPARFGIRGAAFSWQHATMDWRRADQWVVELYRSIRGSRVLPVYGFDFWSLPYLLGLGFDRGYLDELTDLARPMMLASMEPGGAASRADLARLVAATAAQRPHGLAAELAAAAGAAPAVGPAPSPVEEKTRAASQA